MSQGGGEKVRLRISACDKQGNTYQAIGSPPPFNAMLNPSAIKRSLAIDYDVKEVPGLSAQTPKFQSTQSGGLSFELLLDGTGAVPDSSDQTVTQRVEALGKLVYQYAGQKHDQTSLRDLALRWPVRRRNGTKVDFDLITIQKTRALSRKFQNDLGKT